MQISAGSDQTSPGKPDSVPISVLGQGVSIVPSRSTRPWETETPRFALDQVLIVEPMSPVQLFGFSSTSVQCAVLQGKFSPEFEQKQMTRTKACPLSEQVGRGDATYML